jgi:hypothetical protein
MTILSNITTHNIHAYTPATSQTSTITGVFLPQTFKKPAGPEHQFQNLTISKICNPEIPLDETRSLTGHKPTSGECSGLAISAPPDHCN